MEQTVENQTKESAVPRNNKLARFNPSDLAVLSEAAYRRWCKHSSRRESLHNKPVAMRTEADVAEMASEGALADKYKLLQAQIELELIEEVKKLI